MSQLSKIPTDKLEKIHYTQVQIIKARKKSGQIEGIQIKASNFRETADQLTSLLKEIFTNAGPPGAGDMLGLHYYVAVLNKLPLARVENLEIETAREIKRRRELIRQRLDAGNIEKVVREELKG